jgi:hypothetical protein
MEPAKCAKSLVPVALVLGLLCLLMPSDGCAQAEPKVAVTSSGQSQLAKDLIGAWILVGTPEKVGKPPVARRRRLYRKGGIRQREHCLYDRHDLEVQDQDRGRHLYSDWRWEPLLRGLETRKVSVHTVAGALPPARYREAVPQTVAMPSRVYSLCCCERLGDAFGHGGEKRPMGPGEAPKGGPPESQTIASDRTLAKWVLMCYGGRLSLMKIFGESRIR